MVGVRIMRKGSGMLEKIRNLDVDLNLEQVCLPTSGIKKVRMGFDILCEQVNGEPYVPFATRQMCTFVRPHQAYRF